MHASCAIHGPAEGFICFVSISVMQERITTEWPAPALGIPPLLHHGGWDVSIRHSIRLWQLSFQTFFCLPQIFRLRPAVCGTVIRIFR